MAVLQYQNLSSWEEHLTDKNSVHAETDERWIYFGDT
jgi:hypothetical protein